MQVRSTSEPAATFRTLRWHCSTICPCSIQSGSATAQGSTQRWKERRYKFYFRPDRNTEELQKRHCWRRKRATRENKRYYSTNTSSPSERHESRRRRASTKRTILL